MTKREAFTAIKTIVVDNEELVAFVDKELELLDKRNSANSKAKAEKAEANAKIADEIVAAVGELGNATTMQIGAAVGISPQKATPILKTLVESGRVVVTTEKRKKLYSLPIE